MGQVVRLTLPQNVQLIGEWQIDYTTWRVRGNGQFGPFFGTSVERMAMSVPLRYMDRAYTPEDLEFIKTNRLNKDGAVGVRGMHLKLRSFQTGELRDAYCFKNVIRDRFGLVEGARGVLFASSAVTSADDALMVDQRHENALRHLVEATEAIGQLGFDHLRKMLQVVFKEVAQDAILKQLPQHRPLQPR